IRLVRGAEYVRLAADEVFLQLASLAFDPSTFEIWGALLNGAHLVIPPPGLMQAEQLGLCLRRYSVTTLWLTSRLFQAIVDVDPNVLAPLRQLLVGGEVVPVAQVKRLMEAAPLCSIINGYGPTENTVF